MLLSNLAMVLTSLSHPECARGVRVNDPAFGIIWPLPFRIMSEKDPGYPDFER